MFSSVKNTVSLVLITLLAGCAAPAIKEDVSTEFSKEGLHAVRSSGFDEAYVHPDAGLADYKAVSIEALQSADVHITQSVASGTARRDWQMTAEREANLALHLPACGTKSSPTDTLADAANQNHQRHYHC